MIRKDFMKSVSRLLAAALIASQLVVPVAAAEATTAAESTETVETETATEETVSEESTEESSALSSNDADEAAVAELLSDEETVLVSDDEVETQSMDSKLENGYSISLNKGYFYQYDKGYYIRPEATIVLSGNKVVAHVKASTGTGTISSNGDDLCGSDWRVYYRSNYCAANSSDYHYGTYGTGAVVAYSPTEKIVISETFKILKSKSLKLSKTKIYGVENRDASSASSLSQDSATLFYYDTETLHYYPLIEGVDYTKTVTKASEKKGLVTFTPASGSVWDGTKKKKYSLNSKTKLMFTDPSNITVSLNYTRNSKTYTMGDYEEFEYTGSKIKGDTISVTLTTADGTKLTSGTDYKVKFSSNKNAGIASIKISPYGSYKKSYQGTIVKYFRIMPYQMTPKYENYISSSTSKQTTDPGLQQFCLDYAKAKGYYPSYVFSSSTSNSYTYSYTGGIVIPTYTRLDFNGNLFSKANTTSRTVLYVLNGKTKRSKTYDNSNPTGTPTCYVFGKGNYGGYAGSYRYTIKTSGSDSDD